MGGETGAGDGDLTRKDWFTSSVGICQSNSALVPESGRDLSTNPLARAQMVLTEHSHCWAGDGIHHHHHHYDIGQGAALADNRMAQDRPAEADTLAEPDQGEVGLGLQS